MITATIYRHGDSYAGYLVEGHAEYAATGEDILCAAVSVLAENTLNSIEQLTDTEVSAQVEEGFLQCSFPGGMKDDACLLMESMILGLSQIAEITDAEDGGHFLTLLFEEV